MIVKIEIECDTVGEFYSHLGAIRAEIKKKAKREGIEPDKWFNPCEWHDDNCYGTHFVTIMEDDDFPVKSNNNGK